MLSFKEFFLQEYLENPFHRRDSALFKGNSINKKTGKLQKGGIMASRYKNRNDINYVNKDKEHKLGAMSSKDNKDISDKYNIDIANMPMGKAKRLGKSNFVIIKTPLGIRKEKK
jgi:hypothetical protein